MNGIADDVGDLYLYILSTYYGVIFKQVRDDRR
jgi:hypothetical protein